MSAQQPAAWPVARDQAHESVHEAPSGPTRHQIVRELLSQYTAGEGCDIDNRLVSFDELADRIIDALEDHRTAVIHAEVQQLTGMVAALPGVVSRSIGAMPPMLRKLLGM